VDLDMKKVIQKEFDVTKWLESEACGRDKCGSYVFCKYCTKVGSTPCEDAYNVFEEEKQALRDNIKASAGKKVAPKKKRNRKQNEAE
jgi:hypothetical protein